MGRKLSPLPSKIKCNSYYKNLLFCVPVGERIQKEKSVNSISHLLSSSYSSGTVTGAKDTKMDKRRQDLPWSDLESRGEERPK